MGETYPERPLTRGDPAEAKQAIEWEAFLKRKIGVRLGRAAYDVFFDCAYALIPLFENGRGLHNQRVSKALFSFLSRLVRASLSVNGNIARSFRENDETPARANREKFCKQISFGRQLSRSDLTTSAFAAPLRTSPTIDIESIEPIA